MAVSSHDSGEKTVGKDGHVGRAYRTGILPGFVIGVVVAVGLAITVDAIGSNELPWVVAAVIIGATLWIGPAFSELYARVYVPHYGERSFYTFAGTITFWIGIVLSLAAIIFAVEPVYVIVILNVIATITLGYFLPAAYDRGWAGGEEKLSREPGSSGPGS